MQIENHKEEVPFAHYEEKFRHADPMEMARRTRTNWDGKQFHVVLMHKSYVITHPVCTIRALVDGTVPTLPVQTFLLRYLLEGKAATWTGGWKTFREMPWGEMYHKPFSGRCLTRAAFAFGTRLEAFRAACEKIGGLPVNHGDGGFEFQFVGTCSYKMRILIWEGDEEFPPSAQILYSDNFAEGFTAEDRVVAADILISAIRSQM